MLSGAVLCFSLRRNSACAWYVRCRRRLVVVMTWRRRTRCWLRELALYQRSSAVLYGKKLRFELRCMPHAVRWPHDFDSWSETLRCQIPLMVSAVPIFILAYSVVFVALFTHSIANSQPLYLSQWWIVFMLISLTVRLFLPFSPYPVLQLRRAQQILSNPIIECWCPKFALGLYNAE